MKPLNKKKLVRGIIVILIIIFLLVLLIFLSLNLIVEPITYWIASNEKARVFISCILGLYLFTLLFNLFYRKYLNRIKRKKFNALKVAYPRKFSGRKR